MRRLVGYRRLEELVVTEALARLYAAAQLGVLAQSLDHSLRLLDEIRTNSAGRVSGGRACTGGRAIGEVIGRAGASADGGVLPVGTYPEELARELEPTAQAIRNWVQQADVAEGHCTDGLTTSEQEELRRLWRENRQLQEEREVLAKAAACGLFGRPVRLRSSKAAKANLEQLQVEQQHEIAA